MKYKVILKKLYHTIKDPVFIVAFVIASLLLLFTKLDGQYTADLTIPITIEGVEVEHFDDERVNIEENKVRIDLRVKGNGYKILQTYFSNVKLPAESFISVQDSGVIKADMLLFERLLSLEFKDLEILKIFNNTLPVMSVVRMRKEVPVKDNITLDLAGQYMQIGETMLEPSTAWISGAKRDLDNITFISTEPRHISNIESHISGSVPLQNIENVTISEKDVYYSINVERFTESKQNNINIQVKDYEGVERYITLPGVISVTYNITQNAYKNFNHSNIVYYADISSRDSVGGNYLGDNKYRILHTELPPGVEIKQMSSELVIVLKSK